MLEDQQEGRIVWVQIRVQREYNDQCISDLSMSSRVDIGLLGALVINERSF